VACAVCVVAAALWRVTLRNVSTDTNDVVKLLLSSVGRSAQTVHPPSKLMH